MNAKFIGGILLIVGTAIGAGMLALPIAAAEVGFWNATFLLFFSWVIMTLGAFFILEVNLCLPPHSNIITMAKQTLGKGAEIITWLIYLLLFYSLISAYIAGGGDFLRGIILSAHIQIPSWVTTLLFTLILSIIVYKGIRTVDYVNRGLMFGKLGIFVLLVFLIIFFISPANLENGKSFYNTVTFTVMLTSFGYASIIPSLRVYFDDDAKKLRSVILVGSLIPLVCYLLWDLAIMGTIPRSGSHGLLAILNSKHSTTDLMVQLNQTLNTKTISILAHIFTSICLFTSFLGVALCLFDFLADGLRLEKVGKNKMILYIATFLPPVIIVLVNPGIFIKALSYAGVYCMILLVLLPALMAWRGRYHKNFKSPFVVPGGKFILALVISVAVGVIAASVFQFS